MIGPLRSLNRL